MCAKTAGDAFIIEAPNERIKSVWSAVLTFVHCFRILTAVRAITKCLPRSSRGPGHHPLKVETGVRLPYGVQEQEIPLKSAGFSFFLEPAVKRNAASVDSDDGFDFDGPVGGHGETDSAAGVAPGVAE